MIIIMINDNKMIIRINQELGKVFKFIYMYIYIYMLALLPAFSQQSKSCMTDKLQWV